jgi:hypothetical protein
VRPGCRPALDGQRVDDEETGGRAGGGQLGQLYELHEVDPVVPDQLDVQRGGLAGDGGGGDLDRHVVRADEHELLVDDPGSAIGVQARPLTHVRHGARPPVLDPAGSHKEGVARLGSDR